MELGDIGEIGGAFAHTEVSQEAVAAREKRKLEQRVSRLEHAAGQDGSAAIGTRMRLEFLEDTVERLDKSNTALCVAVSCLVLALVLMTRHA